MKSAIGFIATIIVGLLIVFLGGNEYVRYQCNNFQRITGKTVRYAQFDACYVETPTGFQRWDEYKLRSAASEGLLKR